MTYDPHKKAFIIPTEDMEIATDNLLWAMLHARKAGGISADAYEDPPGAMKPHDFAQAGIFDALTRLGVWLPANRYYELDLRKYET